MVKKERKKVNITSESRHESENSNRHFTTKSNS